MLNNVKINRGSFKVGVVINLMRSATRLTRIVDELAVAQAQAAREGPPTELTGFTRGQVRIIPNEEMCGWAGKGKGKGKMGQKGTGKGKYRDIQNSNVLLRCVPRLFLTELIGVLTAALICKFGLTPDPSSPPAWRKRPR